MTVLTCCEQTIPCKVMVRRDWDEWEVQLWITGSAFSRTGFEGSYHFRSADALCRALERLHRRVLDPAAGRPLAGTGWPHRPLRQRKDCRYIGTLRTLHGTKEDRGLRRAFAFAIVPGKHGPVLEASQWPRNESFIHLPIAFLLTIRDAVRMAVEAMG